MTRRRAPVARSMEAKTQAKNTGAAAAAALRSKTSKCLVLRKKGRKSGGINVRAKRSSMEGRRRGIDRSRCPDSRLPLPRANEQNNDGVSTSVETEEEKAQASTSPEFQTRSAIIRAGSLAVAAGSLYVGIFRTKAYRYLSLQGLLTEFGNMMPGSKKGNDNYQEFEKAIEEFEKAGRGVQVPEFQKGLTWFNSAPLSMSKDLKGKVVILDFWTYCCINCMHVLPELRKLEEDFAGKPFAVVGVHSAKFDNEKDDDAIRNAIVRYDVQHPAVNDQEMSMWRSLGINSWPSLLVVTPNGKVLARFAGEGHYEDLKDVISAALNYYGDRNELSNTPLKESLEKNKDTRLLNSPLRYPGKIAVDKMNKRLFIADSGNHRIVVCKYDGTFIEEIGCGLPCLNDGTFMESGFNSPQGLAYDESSNTLYVADTENHAFRSIDLSQKKVKTLLGDGTRGFDLTGGKSLSDQKLNSPWDLCLSKDRSAVYIAMAGQHQIWSYDKASGLGSVYSGNGYERNYNSGYPATTSWAQPSGLSLSSSGNTMYVADSESSSVRSLDLTSGSSNAEAGGDPGFADNLFAFGDKDGKGAAVRLQHPLAVCAAGDETVYIADSYNHKIKVLDTKTDSVKTLAGSDSAGYKDGELASCMLSEPAGLAICEDDKALLIADTNNFLIRKLDLASNTMSTLDLSSIPRPNMEKPQEEEKASDLKIPPGATLVTMNIGTSTEGTVDLQVNLPEEFHYTKGAKSSYEVNTFKSSGLVDSSLKFDRYDGPLSQSSEVVKLRYNRAQNGSPEVALVNMKIFYCKEESACAVHFVTFKLDFGAVGSDSEATTSKETYDVPVPVADDYNFGFQ